MTLTEQIRAEKAAARQAYDEAYRRHGAEQYERFRTDAERARLASTDAARIGAEQALNDARREGLLAERAVAQLTQADGASLYFRDLAPHKLTAAARRYVERGRASQEALEIAREALQAATRAHNAAVSEIDAAALNRRRAQKIAAGELGTKGGA